jgi:hypothetical protein
MCYMTFAAILYAECFNVFGTRISLHETNDAAVQLAYNYRGNQISWGFNELFLPRRWL